MIGQPVASRARRVQPAMTALRTVVLAVVTLVAVACTRTPATSTVPPGAAAPAPAPVWVGLPVGSIERTLAELVGEPAR